MTESERTRFHLLRQRDLAGDSMTAEEISELTRFVATLESAESASLQASREVGEKQIAILDEQVAQMRSLVARREALAEYLRQVIQQVDAERDAIEIAFRQLVDPTVYPAKNLAGVAR